MSKMMKNGYYISCYFSIDRICNLFDVSLADRHDQNMALWFVEDGRINLIAYWELERYTRIKHFNKAWFDKKQIYNVINQLLKPYDLTVNDIVHFFGTPELDDEISYDNSTMYTYHNLCHLFSAILLDSEAFYNRNILGMALDYGSDYETENVDNRSDFVGCLVQKGEITLFPIQSPAALWAVAAEANNMGEGSLMALATATTCKIQENMEIDKSDFTHIYSKRIWEIYYGLVEHIKDMSISEFRAYSQEYDDRFSLKENKISSIMKIIQSYSVQIMDKQVSDILKKSGLKGEDVILAVGGGFCLNCPTNAFLIEKYNFADFMVAPCINDGGQSLGIGLYEFYKRNDRISFSFGQNPFRGGTFYNSDFIKSLKNKNCVKSITGFCADTVAKDLLTDVIVWYDGNAEIGPRALGHRSLLGNAANPQTKIRLNDIKRREFWRPVAPIVMEEEAAEYFYNIQPSPYMLIIYRIRKRYLKELQSIAHLDGTARVQTVSKNNLELGKIYDILSSIKKYTGYPIICNTSLNDKGEPIIESPLRAIQFALEKGISIVYINGNRIELDTIGKNDLQYSIPQIDFRKKNVDKMKRVNNPYQVNESDIQVVYRKFRRKFNLLKFEDSKEVTILASQLHNDGLKRKEKSECI